LKKEAGAITNNECNDLRKYCREDERNMDESCFQVDEEEVGNVLSLHGKWRFCIDREDRGIIDEWYKKRLSDGITLPGTLQSQGYGDDISTETEWVSSLHDPLWYLRDEYKKYAEPGNIKVPFCLQPKKHYRGAAWYQTDVIIPEKWRGQRISLMLERVNWESTLWLDDVKIGSQNSLSTPHVYDFGIINPGKHTITIRVDNRTIINIRPDSHSISDSVGNTWNGIIGKINLFAVSPVWIEDVQVYTDIEKKALLLKIKVGNITGCSGSGILEAGDSKCPVSWNEEGGYGELNVQLDKNVSLWDEFNPSVYKIDVKLTGDNANDIKSVTFGLREMGTEGTCFTINKRKIHFRGTHDGGVFPLTGYTAMDVESWRHIFKVCKEYGLNHVRYHSFCPPEAAFVAADEVGIYLQPECALWTPIFSGSEAEQWLYQETERILKAYGNHPSFTMLTYGNEPSGRWLEPLSDWLKHFKQKDPRRLYCMQTGRQAPIERDRDPYEYWNNEQPEQQYLVMSRIGFDRLRGPGAWNGKDYRDIIGKLSVPIITHEMGQWCAYPNLEEIKKYTGHLQAKNFEIFKESLEENGMLDQAKDFLMASGKLQTLLYKEEIEVNMRTPQIGGFQLLDIHDYPGQGTALVGVLDAMWDSKGYVTPQEFRRFCNTTVPLARFEKRVFLNSEKAHIPVDIYHYGEIELENADILWKVVKKDGSIMASGKFESRSIPFGSGIPIDEIFLDFADWDVPGQYELAIGIKDTPYENRWDFWVYPDDNDEKINSDVFITEKFDDETEEKLNNGENVLFLASAQLSWENPPFSFYPIFWNRAMNPKWERSLGILCSPDHPALSDFPTDFHAGFQWEEILDNRCRAINLNLLNKNIKPIVQGIDDWNRNYKLGIIFECRIGKGKMLVCSADLKNDMDKRPAARQLLKSLVNYMKSDRFDPSVTVTFSDINKLFFNTGIMKELGAKISADAESEFFKAELAIDGDPNTFWLSAGFGGRGMGRQNSLPPQLDNQPQPKGEHQQNDILQGNIQQNDIQQNDTRQKDIQRNNVQQSNVQPNSVQLNGIQSGSMEVLPRDLKMGPDFKMRPEIKKHPHNLVIEFEDEVPMSGIVIMQRQNDFMRKGHIKDYSICISNDGDTWEYIREGELKSNFEVQKIEFGKTVTARYLKFTSLSGFGEDNVSSLAELAVIYEGQSLKKEALEHETSFKSVKAATDDIDDPTLM